MTPTFISSSVSTSVERGPAEATSRRPPRLSAIATEVRRQGFYRYVLAARVHMVMDALVHRYPDVRTTVLDHARMPRG